VAPAAGEDLLVEMSDAWLDCIYGIHAWTHLDGILVILVGLASSLVVDSSVVEAVPGGRVAVATRWFCQQDIQSQ